MRRLTFVLGLFLASVLGLVMAPSRAAGDESCEEDKQKCEKEKQNCQDLLDNTTYRCQVKSDFGTAFTDCFQFISPGQQSLDFDLAIAGLGETLSCECKARGSFKLPQFGTARDFHCVTPAFTLLSIAFEGHVNGHEKKIKQGQAVNEFGDSFVYECMPDPRCVLVGPLRENPMGNPYRGKQP